MQIRTAIRDLPTSPIGQIAALGMGDPEILGLWYGEGDLPTPDFIGAAATRALAAGHTFYTWKAGLPALRDAIAQYLSGLYRRPPAVERVVVTSSGMSALMLVAQLLIDPGDNLAIAAPVWPNIAAAVRILGGEPRLVSLDWRGGGWQLDTQRLFAACDARTRGIFLNSPSNPTGWVASEEDLAAVLEPSWPGLSRVLPAVDAEGHDPTASYGCRDQVRARLSDRRPATGLLEPSRRPCRCGAQLVCPSRPPLVTCVSTSFAGWR